MRPQTSTAVLKLNEMEGRSSGKAEKRTRRFIHLRRARRQNDSRCKFFFISLVNPDAAARTQGPESSGDPRRHDKSGFFSSGINGDINKIHQKSHLGKILR